MSRSLFTLAALAVIVAGCQDHQHPLGQSTLKIQASASATADQPQFWLLGRTWLDSDGRSCRFHEDGLKVGVMCDGQFTEWKDPVWNNSLYPVVELCRLDAGMCADDLRYFVRMTGQITSSDDRTDSNGKYQLRIGGLQSGARYRVIVAITFTGLADDGYTPVAGWNTSSGKVFGYYDFQENGNGFEDVRFRIPRGELCQGDGTACAETSFDPAGETILAFDTNYELTDGEAIVGLKFPDLGDVLQQRVNIIVERISLADGERCITADRFQGSGFAPGRELAPCYNVRTEPYIDLQLLNISTPIEFGVCLESGAEDFRSLLKLLKWSSVKDVVTDMGLHFDGGFFSCPTTYDPNYAAATAEGSVRFAGTAARLLSPLAALLRPQPVYASMLLSRDPAMGSLMDFSRIVVQADDHYEAVYLTPIGPESSARLNLGPVVPTVGVHLCLKDGDGCAPQTATNHWRGTALWNASAEYYQANWNTPKDQAPGTYLLMLIVRDYIIVAPEQINISFGTASHTHNPGRTLPIKFYLTTAQ
jgi:hypothetical protein